jgi:Zn-dependent M28 family amino/carboxypeptidase
MYRKNLFALAVFSFLMLPRVAAATNIYEIVSQVSQTEYTTFLDGSLYAHIGDNRGYGAQHDLARTNIFNEFQSLGLNPVLDPFTYNSATYYNVVATLPGKVNPNQVYIVGAHFDSVNNPGADDNASGVAGVVEAARVLSHYQFGATLKFIAFDREEQGLKGSYAYAGAHSGDDIRGMISMDMIAYNPLGPLHDQAYVYHANATAPPIATELSNAITEYGNGLSATIAPLASASSDHYPFYAQGFSSVLLIERNVWSNPNYHTAADSVDTANYFDYGYATNMTRGVVGYLATEATTVPEPGAVVMLIAGAIGVAAYAWRRRRPPTQG